MTTADKRSLDEVVTENAIQWLKRRAVSHHVEGREYYLSTLAREMIPHIVSAEELMAEGYDEAVPIDRITKTMGRYLGISAVNKIFWRLDYLDAFCRAMGRAVEELTARNPPKLSPADQQFIEGIVAEKFPWITPRHRKN